MTVAEAKLELARAAAMFGAGGDWGNLLIALRVYNAELQKQLVQSPIDVLQVVQGRAQASAQLLDIFENCRQIAEAASQQKVKINERRLGSQEVRA